MCANAAVVVAGRKVIYILRPGKPDKVQWFPKPMSR